MYIDGFVVPVPRDRVEDYRAISDEAMAIWMDHGAISAVEAMGDDVPGGDVTSFPMAVKAEPGEVVFFSFITFRDRAHRDAVNAAVMADPRLKMPAADAPFDARRMIWGGFSAIVRKGAAA
ncbi:MAG: DUF1428 domain-containing protein [Paracoccaceae bacterium]|nr:MAG: DUF1428 domain-containing protein [Paracoccaceae bacterium]